MASQQTSYKEVNPNLLPFHLWFSSLEDLCRSPSTQGHFLWGDIFVEHKITCALLGPNISLQFSSVTQSCPTLCNSMNRSTPGLPLHHQLPRSSLKLMSIESVMPSSHLIVCRPLLLPPIPPSIRVFSNESTLHMRWPKYWSFSFSIIPSKFRMDWLDLLAV